MEIYEETGPRWRDGSGEEQVGWPRDGYRLLLRKLGPDSYELESEHRHIDGDDSRTTTERLTRAEARAWLTGREGVSRQLLEAHFSDA